MSMTVLALVTFCFP